MPGLVDLVDLISDDVVTQLAASGYAPLVDGQILLGRQNQYEESAPPRIIFIPSTSAFTAKDVYDRSVAASDANRLAQQRNPSILTDSVTFEVRCWGICPSTDPDDRVYDFDFTQTLYQQVIRSVNSLALGSYSVGRGEWTNSKTNASQVVSNGMEFVFQLTFNTPILKLLEALPHAPSDVAPGVTDTLILPSGLSGPGCEEPSP